MISIDEARKALCDGKIIVYPTDTVWGMGCDPFNQKAIDHLFTVKGKKMDGLSIMFSNKKEIERLAQTWRNSGIDEGDTILIHSSIKRTMQDITNKGIPFNADDLLQSFIEAVGINGTLVFPLFNFKSI